jgi:hypothetical protein
VCGSLPREPPISYAKLVSSKQLINRVANNRMAQELLRAVSILSSPQDINKDGSVSKTTWTSADTSSRQDLQGPTVASERARNACLISVNKVVHRLISRNIVWLLKSYVHLGRRPHMNVHAECYETE